MNSALKAQAMASEDFVHLTATESRVLLLLCKRCGEVVAFAETAKELLREETAHAKSCAG
jgi:DNA-binding winged helix-turn-helix (wHTH) protein